MLTYETMRALAPSHLPVYIDLRYDGGGQSAKLTEFSPEDAARLHTLYQSVMGLYTTLKGLASQTVPPPGAAADLKRRPECNTAMDAARAVGRGSKLSPQLGAILHDVRGGSLLALLASIEILNPDAATSDAFLRIFCYARDHLKIMRNGVPDIDPTATAHDREPSPHEIRLLREKWSGGQFSIGGQVKAVRFESLFDGPIANRCMEFSALDRIIYNLMNNAARHGDGPAIALNIFSPNGSSGPEIRFVVQNGVSERQQAKILEIVPSGLGQLFLGGLTTGGSGMGLRICTDFVVRAFGLRSPEQAIADGYVGAQLIERTFVVWFHWPRV
jgi:hypothetical protein